MKIYKYEIPLKNSFVLNLPANTKILSFQTQNNVMFIWCMLDPFLEKECRFFYLYGTGQQIDEKSLKYIGTSQMDNGALVWHLFEDMLDERN